MTRFYDPTLYDQLRKQGTRALIIALVFLLTSIVLVLLSGLLAYFRLLPLTPLKIIDSVLLSAGFALFFYWLMEKRIPTSTRSRFLGRILSVSRYEGEIKVLEVHSPRSIEKGINAYEILAEGEDHKSMAIYLESCYTYPFEVGKQYHVILASNFITDVEESA